MRYAVTNETGAVVNFIEWDGESAFDPGEGLSLRLARDDDQIDRTDEPY